MFEQKIKVKLKNGLECFNDPISRDIVTKEDVEGKIITLTFVVLQALKDKVLIKV